MKAIREEIGITIPVRENLRSMVLVSKSVLRLFGKEEDRVLMVALISAQKGAAQIISKKKKSEINIRTAFGYDYEVKRCPLRHILTAHINTIITSRRASTTSADSFALAT